MNRLSLHFSTLALALSPLVVHAAGGAFEINQDCIAAGCFAGDPAGYPVTITQPGSYILTSDLAPSGNAFLETIIVSAAPVDIDLNGHTIEGGATCSGTPVNSTCTGFTGYSGIKMGNNGNTAIFHVHNGRIHGFKLAGINITDFATGTLLDHLVISENAFGISATGVTGTETVHIRDVDVSRNSTSGITLQGSTLHWGVVENSTVIGNGGYGMQIGNAVVTGSTINDNLFAGINCSGKCAFGQDKLRNNASQGLQWAVSGSEVNMGGNFGSAHVSPFTCP
jgi:hypothetical protein